MGNSIHICFGCWGISHVSFFCFDDILFQLSSHMDADDDLFHSLDLISQKRAEELGSLLNVGPLLRYNQIQPTLLVEAYFCWLLLLYHDYTIPPLSFMLCLRVWLCSVSAWRIPWSSTQRFLFYSHYSFNNDHNNL